MVSGVRAAVCSFDDVVERYVGIHETDYDQTVRRDRCAAASRGSSTWGDGFGTHSRSDRGSPGRSASTTERRGGGKQRTLRWFGEDPGDHPRRDGPVTLVLDAGPLYAYLDRDDALHDASLSLLETHPGPLVVPMLVITEVAYLANRRLGAWTESRFVGDLASGELLPEPVESQDWARIAGLVRRYEDLPLGTADASVVATAERLAVRRVATVDQRHCRVVRPRHVPAFTLLPADDIFG